MQQGAASGSEKSASSSGGHSICSRSDDEKHPAATGKVPWTADSEEAWPTLGQSQEQYVKKKSTKGSSTPRDKTSSTSIDRNRKSRLSRRGVPLAPEDRDQMFYHAKQDRLLKGFRHVDKDKSSHRRSSTQTEIRLSHGGSNNGSVSAGGVSKNKESSEVERTMEPSPAVTTAHPQTPRDATPRYVQGVRGRGRYSGRGRTGRGRAGPPRSHSHDSIYFNMPPSAGMHPPIYPHVPMMHPMYISAMPYAPVPPVPGMLFPPGHPLPMHAPFTRERIAEAAKTQIEYYMSEENLHRDLYVRGKMDKDGWIPLALIMTFHMLQHITTDRYMILEALLSSDKVDVSEDMSFIRTKDYEKWVLPENQQQLDHVPVERAPYTPKPYSSEEKNRHSTEDVFEFDEDRAKENYATQDHQDEFVDRDLDRLIVLIQSHGGSHTKGGTIDKGEASVINEGLAHYQDQIQPFPARSPGHEPRQHFFSSSLPKNTSAHLRKRSVDENQVRHSPSVGWVLGSSSHNRSPSSGTSPTVEGLHLGTSVPRFDHPGHAHLKDGNFVQVHYNKFYSRCIRDRNSKGYGKSEEMRTLYRFWCYFLRDNFNSRMYTDFKKFAIEDREEGGHYGIECLFNFYSYGLESRFNDELYSDFEDLTLMDYEQGSLYGLEKFWAFHHYGRIPESHDVHVNPKLRELIEKQYSTLDDFRRKSEASKSHAKESFIHCTSPSSTLTSGPEQPSTIGHRMTSVKETENVLSVQNESLSVA